MLTVPRAAAMTLVTELGSSTASFLGDVQLHLYTNAGLVITPAIALSDLTEANFSGYGVDTVALALSGPVADVSGNGMMVGARKVWIADDTTTANTVYGVFATGLGADSTTLKFVDPAPSGINLNFVGAFCAYTMYFPYPGPVAGDFQGPSL